MIIDTKRQGLNSVDAILDHLELKFDITTEQLYIKHQGEEHEVSRKKAIVTSENNIYGIVSYRYVPFNYSEIFGFLDNFKDQIEFDKAGRLAYDKSAAFISCKLPDKIAINGDDLINHYIVAYSKNDGKSSIKFIHTPIRVVCTNTLMMALNDERSRVAIKHIGSAKEKVKAYQQSIEDAVDLAAGLKLVLEEFRTFKFSNDDKADFIKRLVATPKEIKEGNMANATIKRINEIDWHIRNGIGQNKHEGTLLNVINGVTHYTSHSIVTTDEVAQINSTWFGKDQELTKKAFSLANNIIN